MTDLPSNSRISDSTSNLSRQGDGPLTKNGQLKQVNPQKQRKRKRSCDSSSDQSTKVPKTDACKAWQDKWLLEFKWLKYENGAMFCTLCILYKNKSKFSQNGSTNLRISTLHDHESSSGQIYCGGQLQHNAPVYSSEVCQQWQNLCSTIQ